MDCVAAFNPTTVVCGRKSTIMTVAATYFDTATLILGNGVAC